MSLISLAGRSLLLRWLYKRIFEPNDRLIMHLLLYEKKSIESKSTRDRGVIVRRWPTLIWHGPSKLFFYKR